MKYTESMSKVKLLNCKTALKEMHQQDIIGKIQKVIPFEAVHLED